MRYIHRVLSNGLRLVISPMASLESATVMVVIGTGSRYETKVNNGISHFLEHMAFKGTTKRPSALAISTLIDSIGGEFNAFTSKEMTGFYIKSATSHLETLLDVLSDMMMHPKLDEKEIEKERGVILEEINMYEDVPMRKIGDIYERLLYGDTPLGWDIAGENENIKKIMREDFVRYMDSFYSAKNMAVVVTGGINEAKTQKLVEKYFGKMPSFDTLRCEKVIDDQEKPAYFVKQKKTEQMHIALGFRTTSIFSEERYVLSVLSAILGGGMSSRLFHEVREKRGLAYYVRSVSEHYQDCGTFISFAGLDPKRVEEAISVILNEFQKIKSNPAKDKKELKKAKEYLKGHLILELEDSRAVAGFFAQQEILENRIETLETALKRIDAVTASELEAVANKYFTEKSLNLAIIGDFPDGQKLEKLLNL